MNEELRSKLDNLAYALRDAQYAAKESTLSYDDDEARRQAGKVALLIAGCNHRMGEIARDLWGE